MNLLAQNTIFRWILRSQVTKKILSFTTQIENISMEYLKNKLRKFWEVVSFNLHKIRRAKIFFKSPTNQNEQDVM